MITSGFLPAKFAGERLGDGLSGVEVAAGDRPLATVRPTYQQHLVVGAVTGGSHSIPFRH
nr:hypothetical protein [Actinopolymorpha alba]